MMIPSFFSFSIAKENGNLKTQLEVCNVAKITSVTLRNNLLWIRPIIQKNKKNKF